MLIQKEIKIDTLSRYESLDDSILCFDIETTGLNRNSTHLTVIGTGYVSGDVIVFRQWLLEHPAREREMLEEFSAYLRRFTAVLQFNGDAFDIPYVKKRCALLGLPDPFAHLCCIDLYRSAKKARSLLDAEDLKQKTLEPLFEIPRRDQLSGRDCILAYRDYLQNADLRARDDLLLHNEEDVTGLLQLSGLRALEALADGVLSVTDRDFSGDDFRIRFSLKYPLPFPLQRFLPYAELAASGYTGSLTLRGVYGRRKYFFPDYTSYYYLPAEDCAVHKSVGIYVDKAHRVRATRETCYEKQEGLFYYQPEDLMTPAFREDVRDPHSWITRQTLQNAADPALSALVAALLRQLR